MKKVCIRPRNQMPVINISKLTDSSLYDLFIQSKSWTIYVENTFGEFIGIITLGDFRRNQINGKELLNSRSTKINICNERNAIQILEQKSWMDSIPIIDDRGFLVKEYYTYNSKKNNSYKSEYIYGLIHQIITEMDITSRNLKTKRYNKVVFLTNALNDMQLENLRYKFDGIDILSTDSLSLNNLKQYARETSTFIFDFCIDTYAVRKIFYDKYCINNVKWDLDEDEFHQAVLGRRKYFSGVAFINNRVELTKLGGYKKEDLNIYELSEKKLVWNERECCYEIFDDIDEEIECLFVLFSFFENPYIICYTQSKKRYLPILGLKYVNNQYERRAISYDIACNIIPALQKNNIKVLVLRDPNTELDKISDIIPYDLKQINRNIFIEKQRKKDFFRFEDSESEKIENELRAMNSIWKKGIVQLNDQHGKYVNIVDGERYTCGNSNASSNTLFFFGPCFVWGSYVEDECTVCSYLKKNISEPYYVRNCGNNYECENYIMRDKRYRSGDIAIIMAYDNSIYEFFGTETHSIIDAYRNTPELPSCVLDSLLHANKVVTENVAEEIYHICMEGHLLDSNKDGNSSDLNSKMVYFGYGQQSIPEELLDWLHVVSKKYKKTDSGKTGAIVMNANPFTLGHRYLAETAAKQVDTLYIFVVEEDKSFFDFKSRFDMVTLGVSDLENVIVVPSGSYIISSKTLPGYFEKESGIFFENDASNDLHLFSEHIAKEFGISVRFAGEEPTDEFTRKYNESMSHILPAYNIEFCEIPRKQCDGKAISASLVRMYMKECNYAEIKKLVMPDVYKYLKEHFMKP